jgi:predicted PurR-regulated permease PerM
LALGVRYPFTLGIIAGLTRAIPVIGPLLGAIPLALVCFLTTNSVSTTSLLLLGFTLMHFLESKVLLPRVIGHEVDLHPVTVIIALLVGMEFFGFLGVFLAVPLAAILKIILAEWHAGRQVPILTTGTAEYHQIMTEENGLASEATKEKRE